MTSEQGIARVRGVLRRRRLWVVATGAVVLAASAMAIGRMKPVYKASAVVRALESQPAREYVPPAVVEQIGERLRTLRLAVMARPILDEVAREMRLAEGFGVPEGEVVDSMRARMDVKLEGDDTFLVSYEDSDAWRAREVVDRVVAKFVARQVTRRVEVTEATVTALRGQVMELRPKLHQLDAVVREFKIAHDGSLPEQQEHNLRTLDQTTMEINILSTNLDLGEERRRQLLLGAMSPMRHQEQALQTALHDALTKYTADHPEVQRIRAELENVTSARVTDEAKIRADASTNPEIAALGREIDREKAQMAALRQRQEEARVRLAGMARNGQALAEMATDLDATRQKYQAALSKLHDAELAAAVEANLRGQRFETVEGAARPAHPIRPDRPLLGLGALLAALLLGLGAGFARDFADSSIHAPEQVAALGRGAPIEVLACVPEMESEPST